MFKSLANDNPIFNESSKLLSLLDEFLSNNYKSLKPLITSILSCPEIYKKISANFVNDLENFDNQQKYLVLEFYQVAAWADLQKDYIVSKNFTNLWEKIKNFAEKNYPAIYQNISHHLNRTKPLDNINLNEISVAKIPLYDKNFEKLLALLFDSNYTVNPRTKKYHDIITELGLIINLHAELSFFNVNILQILNNHEYLEENKLSDYKQKLQVIVADFINAYKNQSPKSMLIAYEFFYDILEYLIDLKDFQSSYAIVLELKKYPELTDKLKHHQSSIHKHDINLEKYFVEKFNPDNKLEYLGKFKNMWKIPNLDFYFYLAQDLYKKSDNLIDLFINIGSIKSELIDLQINLANLAILKKPFLSHSASQWFNKYLT